MQNASALSCGFAARRRLLPVLWLAVAPLLPAQANRATLLGVVRDAAAAALPGATVTARHADTNQERTVRTGPLGEYAIPSLTPGVYELLVEAPSFRSERLTGVVLEVGQEQRRDVTLQVGAIAEEVTVVAEAAALNTENGAVKGDVIVQKEIANLPLDGRDFTDLAFLVPGVLPTAQGGQGSAMATNGARPDSTNFYVDGFNNRNPRGAAAQVRPNMGAMQEFKVETSGFSAEYGRMAGGVLNMVLRSGSNRLHGELFEYVRNNVMDARAFFDSGKLKLNRHQYGATLSGPALIPRLYKGADRTFFLFSWESYKQLVGTTAISHTPSLLERAGDFSETLSQTGNPVAVRDPFNANRPFPGNAIPASRFHPIAVKLLDSYPPPNRAATEVTFTTMPWPRLTMPGRRAWVRKKAEVTFRQNT